MGSIRTVLPLIRGILRDRAEFAAENLALCRQIVVLERTPKCPRTRMRAGVFQRCHTARTSHVLCRMHDLVECLHSAGADSPCCAAPSRGYFLPASWT